MLSRVHEASRNLNGFGHFLQGTYLYHHVNFFRYEKGPEYASMGPLGEISPCGGYQVDLWFSVTSPLMLGAIRIFALLESWRWQKVSLNDLPHEIDS